MTGETDARRAAARPEERLGVALLLSASGGYLDAFTWIAHGQVFANAQTGNVVLLGVATASGDWELALRHVPPILAFVVGVYVAHRLRRAGAMRGSGFAARLSLLVELLLLCVVAVLPRSVPDLPIVLGIAFTAALQSSSFRVVEGAAYSSVMTTGNLRQAAELVFAGASEPASRRQGLGFVAICAAFAAGAALGGVVTGAWGNPAVWVPIGVLGVVFWLCV